MKKIVLMYHSIGDKDWVYSLPLSTFKEHLNAIKAYPDRVVLTFDDAYEDIFVPLVESELIGIETIVFVPAERIGGEVDGRRVMGWKELGELRNKGIKIGLHGLSHLPIGSLEHLEYELTRGREILYGLIGDEFLFSFPNGVVPKGAEEVLNQQGVRWAFSSEPGIWQGQYIAPRFVIRRGDSVRELEALLQFNWWTISRRRAERGLLSLAKSILGREGYDRLKAFLLGRT